VFHQNLRAKTVYKGGILARNRSSKQRKSLVVGVPLKEKQIPSHEGWIGMEMKNLRVLWLFSGLRLRSEYR